MVDAARLNAVLSKTMKAMKPPEQMTVSEWADKKRQLSQESSAEAGRWRTSRTPYLREIMDAFSDPLVRNIVFVSSSQVGKSEAINNMIGYIIDQDPGSILFIHPTTIDAKEYSKLRLAPMIRDCKCLRNKVATSKSRDSNNTILQKAYPGGIMTLCGSTEAHALASKPIRYIFGDERDRWALSAGEEGDPWKLAMARQITFYNAKAVQVSTPTIKNHSAIASAYESGTKERYKTRCPHCGEYDEITFDQIRWNKLKDGNGIGDIYYICRLCGGVSTEAEIKRSPSIWVAESPEALAETGTRSFWLSSFVSPWASWRGTIIEYTGAIGSTEKLQVVFNTLFGKLWENRGDDASEDELIARREDYDAELPDGVLFLTAGVDTQDDRLEYEIVGHGHFGETWGIKCGMVFGRPDDEKVWKELDSVLDRVYKFADGKGLRVSMTFVDEGGHFVHEVRLRCRERAGKKVFPIKGRGGDSIPYTSPPKNQKILIGGKGLGSCLVFGLGVDAGKQAIMDSLKVQTPGARYCHFPNRDDYGPAFFKGLVSETRVYSSNRKNPWHWEIIPGHERNERLDCRNYAMAAAKVLSPDCDELERRIREAEREEEKPISAISVRKKKKPTGKTIKKVDRGDDW